VNAAAARRWKPVAVAAAAALAVAGLGALMTDLGTWYAGLRQPSWKPPDWLFGPAWTLIFALTALAGVEGWRCAADRAGREWPS
jgi:tryptophan-rich sensory protein